MDFIKNLPWGWIIGLAALAFVARSLSSQIAEVSQAAANSGGGGSSNTGVTPMFGVSAGGSFAGSSSDVPVLGGDEWGAPTGDTGLSDAVLIQQSNERIAQQNFEMQRYVADKSFQLLYQPTTTTNSTGNMEGQYLPPVATMNGSPLQLSPGLQRSLEAMANNPQAQFQAGYNNSPSQNLNSGRVATSDAVAYIAKQAKTDNWYAVYDQAKSRGYSAAETASLINRSGVPGAGALSAADVNAWTREKGLSTLH